jgi:hypothetical protein
MSDLIRGVAFDVSDLIRGWMDTSKIYKVHNKYDLQLLYVLKFEMIN